MTTMTNTPDILKKIITRKEAEVAECKKNISEKQMLDAAYKDRDTRDTGLKSSRNTPLEGDAFLISAIIAFCLASALSFNNHFNTWIVKCN
jgi:hypothetical protein